MNIRHVKEGLQEQGEDEKIVYTLTTTPWGSTPSSVGFVLYNVSGETWTDVTAAKASGSATVSGDIITLPQISGLVDGTRYRGEVKFTCGSNVFEAYFEIQATK